MQIEQQQRFAVKGDVIIDFEKKCLWSKTFKRLPWEKANAFCEQLTLENLTGWELPSTDDLQSLIQEGKAPYIDKSIFSDAKPYVYWTKNPYPYIGAYAGTYEYHLRGIVLFGPPPKSFDTESNRKPGAVVYDSLAQHHYFRAVKHLSSTEFEDILKRI